MWYYFSVYSKNRWNEVTFICWICNEWFDLWEIILHPIFPSTSFPKLAIQEIYLIKNILLKYHSYFRCGILLHILCLSIISAHFGPIILAFLLTKGKNKENRGKERKETNDAFTLYTCYCHRCGARACLHYWRNCIAGSREDFHSKEKSLSVSFNCILIFSAFIN